MLQFDITFYLKVADTSVYAAKRSDVDNCTFPLQSVKLNHHVHSVRLLLTLAMFTQCIL